MSNCYRCGAPWAGWGVECNTCRGIRKMEEISGSRDYTPGQTMSRKELVIYICIGIFICSRGDWAVGKFLWFFVKMGLYLMFGWWTGASMPSAH